MPRLTVGQENGASAEKRNDRFVVGLDEVGGDDLHITGGKAAALAKATRAGLSTLPGWVLTTSFCEAVDAGQEVATHAAVRDVYERAGGGARALVARSSSVVEDSAESSMAGRFESVIGIVGFEAFVEAVVIVLDSRRRAEAMDHPIAVLVQPLIEPAFGGVLFGVDPVTGRSDRRVVSAVVGGPEPLVSGEVDGSRFVLALSGRPLQTDTSRGPSLTRDVLRRLSALSSRVEGVYGSPQDVEWAVGADGALWLLQSRPVTTTILGVPSGPVYGPGPIAETFPEPLTELEYDLWVPPLRDAVRQAVLLAGAVPRSAVNSSDVVIAVHGHVAIDLLLAGEIPSPKGLVRRLNPVPAVRRLRSSWRTGRLRTAIPKLAEHLLDRVDADLESVPDLSQLTSRQLLALLHRTQVVLRALHAHEILMGMLVNTGQNRMTGASVALRVLVEARRDGLTDTEILERSPVVLALTAPRVGPAPVLPGEASVVSVGDDSETSNDNGILREALRLRVRWIQELSGRAAWELGCRLATAGDFADPELIRHMTLEHLEAVATNRAVVVRALIRDHHHDFGLPLPAWFQMSDTGVPIRAQCANEVGGGTGAGGGSATGVVTYDSVDPPMGSVLVTTTLTPNLAPLLTRLRGIVAETGSVLSHLAILAREARVPTVVGYAGATSDLPEGAVVLVDGDTGRVTITESFTEKVAS